MLHKIMIVDDEPANLRLLERLFRKDYQIIAASSGEEALRLLEQHSVALLITDQRMPGMTGIELLKRTAELRPHMVRMILTGYTDIGTLVEAINCGEIYKYVTKPWSNEDLRLTVSRALEHYETTKARHELGLTNKRLVEHLEELTRGFVRAIADALEAKDDYMRGHAKRVSGYATAIGRRMNLEREALEQLSLAAFLHDIGKIGTPDHILLKPTALTDEERIIVNLHPERGARMLAGISQMQETALAVRHHHEHFDGTGYPDNLRATQIPLAARIIHVADAYDAITNPRPFREARAHDEALASLQGKAGTQFDPEVVQAFCDLEAIGQIRRSIASIIYAENGSQLFNEARRFCDADALDSDELVREIEVDPILALNVLHEANTKFGDDPTANLRIAATRLGEDRLRKIVKSNTTQDGQQLRSPAAEEAWERALRTGAAARLLAEHTAIINADDAYTIGLLHDTGETLLHQLFPTEMESVQNLAEDRRLEREVALFGVDHAQVGEWMLESCGVPRALTAVVQTHHDVQRTNTPAALLLYMADAVARTDESYKAKALDALGTDRLQMLHISRADLADIHTRSSLAIEQQLSALSYSD